MNKFTKMFAFASLASLAILSGCSESEEPDPTKAEQCAAGISQDCMIGTWTFDGVKSIEQNTFYEGFSYAAAPGYMKFYVDTDKRTKVKTNMFEFSWPSTSPHAAELDCNPVYGEWSVTGTTLTLKSTGNNMCFSPRGVTVDPKITNDGAKIELQLGKLWLSANSFSELGIGTATQVYYTEVFSISATAK